ncbi:hypothetical protein THRCLA_07687 [Thraustotheca clavata]|uniref:Uncharacterized protein n=1 Tax=Thraustotheca clavata TaxID=74557 RepID=A0A1V9ZCD7_9STRA|nr:hypothetical protein THRCLA_07687 [Thraustotheca clavata]
MVPSKVSVRNLPTDASAESLRPLFKKFGKISALNIHGDGSASIEFQKISAVVSSVASMNNALIGGKRIQVLIDEGNDASSNPRPKKTLNDKNNDNKNADKALRKVDRMCRNFAAGRCKRGDACQYKHDYREGIRESSLKMSKKICNVVAMNGVCTKGDKCKFSHDLGLSKALKRKIDTPASAPTKKLKIPPVKVPQSIRDALKPVAPAPAKKPSTLTLCAECTKEPATLHCEQCEEPFCNACDKSSHSSRVMSKHTRKALKVDPVCAECRSEKATVRCLKCEMEFCSDCSWKIHEFRVFRSHRREAFSSSSKPTEEVKPATPIVAEVAKPAATDASNDADSESSESEEDEAEEPKQIAAPAVNTFVRPAPKTELSSDSSDDDDEEAPSSVVPASSTTASAPEPSSEDESEEEIKPKAFPQSVPKTELSSESEEDEEDEAPVPVKKAVAAADSSSDSSSSDEERAPVVKKAAIADDESSDSESDYVDKKVAAKKSSAPVAGSSHSVVKKIEAYAASDSTEVLHLSPDLNSFERLLAHDCAERLELSHVSVGEGLERHITISKEASKKTKKSWSKSRA